MNLHLVPDDKYVNRFVGRLDTLKLLASNRIVVKAPPPFKYIVHAACQGARVGSAEFNLVVGDVSKYDQVFIHFMDEESIDFLNATVAGKVTWMPWGADVFESLYSSFKIADADTEQLLGRSIRNRINSKIYKTYERARKRLKYARAYSRIGYIANWLEDEYAFAVNHLPALKARRKFFLYDVDTPLHQLRLSASRAKTGAEKLKALVGYSASPANNHASALRTLSRVASVSEVAMPVSYGDTNYLGKLRSWVSAQNFSFATDFNQSYRSFTDYADYMNSFDLVVLNSKRPAGLGNFWLAIYLGKTVFLNGDNVVAKSLKKMGLDFYDVSQLPNLNDLAAPDVARNRQICLEFFDERKIDGAYRELFS